MFEILLSDLETVCEAWHFTESFIRAKIDPENDEFDPTFPKPYSRDNDLYWNDDEIHEWYDFQNRLLILKNHGIISFLK